MCSKYMYLNPGVDDDDNHMASMMRVVNGHSVKAGQLPWMISIRDNDGFAFCGGTIISFGIKVTQRNLCQFQ